MTCKRRQAVIDKSRLWPHLLYKGSIHLPFKQPGIICVHILFHVEQLRQRSQTTTLSSLQNKECGEGGPAENLTKLLRCFGEDQERAEPPGTFERRIACIRGNTTGKYLPSMNKFCDWLSKTKVISVHGSLF